MTQPAKVQEPSMEEILASIRRIIADDETAAPAAPEPAAVKTAPTPERSVASASLRSAAINGNAATERAAEPPKLAGSAGAKVPDPLDQLLAEGIGEAMSKRSNAPVSHEQVSHDKDDDHDVFELTDEMALPPSASAKQPAKEATKDFNKVEPADDVVFADMHATPPMHHRPTPEAAPSMRYTASSEKTNTDKPTTEKPHIMSNATMSAVESAFNSLATTVLSNNARTLEDLVREMLRPMLKTWLDDNLPGLVERIVRAEIERVSRGR